VSVSLSEKLLGRILSCL